MTQLQALYRLQEIDLRMLKDQKRLNEIAAALANDEATRQAQAAVEAAQGRLLPLQKNVCALELEIQSNTEKASATDEQLYSGRVKNPKELQDMQREIASLKKRNQELEDHLLETMLEAEQAEAELAAAQAGLEQVVASRDGENRQLIEEQSQLKTNRLALQSQREQALPEISPEYLQLYNTLRPKKNQQPLALLDGRSCAACRVEQTMNIITEVRRGNTVVYCHSCGRILVSR